MKAETLRLVVVALLVGCAHESERTIRSEANAESSSSPSQIPSRGEFDGGAPNDATASGTTEESVPGIPAVLGGRDDSDVTRASNGTIHSDEQTLTGMDRAMGVADSSIATTIRESMSKDPSIAAFAKRIKISTVGTVVTLEGSVQSRAEKAKISTLASNAPGVTEVHNLLETQP